MLQLLRETRAALQAVLNNCKFWPLSYTCVLHQGWLTVFAMRHGVVGIKGVMSGLYLCMDEDGLAFGEVCRLLLLQINLSWTQTVIFEGRHDEISKSKHQSQTTNVDSLCSLFRRSFLMNACSRRTCWRTTTQPTHLCPTQEATWLCPTKDASGEEALLVHTISQPISYHDTQCDDKTLMFLNLSINHQKTRPETGFFVEGTKKKKKNLKSLKNKTNQTMSRGGSTKSGKLGQEKQQTMFFSICSIELVSSDWWWLDEMVKAKMKSDDQLTPEVSTLVISKASFCVWAEKKTFWWREVRAAASDRSGHYTPVCHYSQHSY